jgi:catechol 2,3-dioxygenase-like lactoylglutathione lyase family enzyme
MGIKYSIKGIQHIGIPTNNIDVTIDFYNRLGFSVALTTTNEAAGERVVFLSLNNLVLEVYESKAAVGKIGAIDHVALDVTDIDATYDFIKSNDYHILSSEIEFLPFWTNGVRFFTILGPNMEKIEFSQML